MGMRGWATFLVMVLFFRILGCFAEMLTFSLPLISSHQICTLELEPTAQHYLLFSYNCSTNHQGTVLWTIWLKVSILLDSLFLWASSSLLVSSFVTSLCFSAKLQYLLFLGQTIRVDEKKNGLGAWKASAKVRQGPSSIADKPMVLKWLPQSPRMFSSQKLSDKIVWNGCAISAINHPTDLYSNKAYSNFSNILNIPVRVYMEVLPNSSISTTFHSLLSLNVCSLFCNLLYDLYLQFL